MTKIEFSWDVIIRFEDRTHQRTHPTQSQMGHRQMELQKPSHSSTGR